MVRKVIPVLCFGLVVGVSAQNPPAQTPPPQTPPPPGVLAQGGRPGGAGQMTVWAPHTVAAEPLDLDLIAKIKTEGMERSKIMWIEHYLTDVYGPRPIGSPNHVAAANWALKTMTSWGMKNAHLEPFTWRGVGWLAAGHGQWLHHRAAQSESEVRGDSLVAVNRGHGQRGSGADHRPRESNRSRTDGVSDGACAPRQGRHRHGRAARAGGGQLQ